MLRRTSNPPPLEPRPDEFTALRVTRSVPVNALGMTRGEALVYAKYRRAADRGLAAPTRREVALALRQSVSWVAQQLDCLEAGRHIARWKSGKGFQVKIVATGRWTRPINTHWRHDPGETALRLGIAR